MKTSNKILLGTLLAILLIVTGIHVAIYAKYKSNDFVTLKILHDERYASYKLNDVHAVVLTGLQNVKIIPSDTARLEVEKVGGKPLGHEIINGVLTIKGDTLIERWNNNFDRERNYRDVIIYLPGIQNIKSDFCNLKIKGAKDSAKSQSYSLDLTNTELNFSYNEHDDEHDVNNFDKIIVTKASRSSIGFAASTFIKEINLNLDSSSFEDGGADVNSISINADSTSSVKLSGKNITKAKFTLR